MRTPPPIQEPVRIFVPKTETELNGDGQYAEQLKTMSGPANLGGVKLPTMEISGKFDTDALKRLQARVLAHKGGMEGGAQ